MTNIVVDEPVDELVLDVVDGEDTNVVPPDIEVPDKFRGKSLEDVVKSYTELEKELGRKANEVGELRKLTDEYLRRELSKAESPKTPEADEDDEDIFATKKTVRTAIDTDPRIKSLEEKIAERERKEALASFTSKHPDYNEIGNDVGFQEWVQKSEYRKSMFARADSMDLAAADELLTMWKDVRKYKAAADASQSVKDKREADLKKASGESSSTGSGKRKVYSRVELMRLRMSDPDKYNAMQEEIVSAYREGRVK